MSKATRMSSKDLHKYSISILGKLILICQQLENIPVDKAQINQLLFDLGNVQMSLEILWKALSELKGKNND